MTKGNGITNKDLYEAINNLRQEIKSEYNHRLECMENQIDQNTTWRNQITGKITVLVAVIGIAVNWAWDALFNR